MIDINVLLITYPIVYFISELIIIMLPTKVRLHLTHNVFPHV